MPDRHRAAGIELARQIADEVLIGPPSRFGHGWIGPEVIGDERDWRIIDLPIGPGLYSGMGGIAMALAAAGRCAADEDLLALAGAVSAESLEAGAELVSSGAVDLASGSSGIAHAASWVGHLTGDRDLLRGAWELARTTARQLVELPGDPDYLGGTAGAIVAVTVTRTDDEEIRRNVRTAAQRLARQARPALLGRCWPDPSGAGLSPGLLGLAHGASGTALALIAAADDGDDELDGVVRAAWDYERSWFDAGAANWPDLRSSVAGDLDGDGQAAGPGVGRGMVAWCHGALGVGCARLAWLSASPDTPLRLPILAEITAATEAARRRAIAARAALRDGLATDVSLCHGLGGITELLLAAADLPGGDDHLRAAARVGDVILAQREHAGSWPCGLPATAASSPSGPSGSPAIGPSAAPAPPGLFLGRAGIALGLLRLDARHELPPMAIPRWIPKQDD